MVKNRMHSVFWSYSTLVWWKPYNSLPGECQENVAASMPICPSTLLAIARLKLSRHRLSSTILNQVCCIRFCVVTPGEDTKCRPEPLGNSWCQQSESAQQKWPKKDRQQQQIVSDSSSGAVVRMRQNHIKGDKIRSVNMELLFFYNRQS